MERAQRTTAAVAPLQEGMARLVDGFEEDLLTSDEPVALGLQLLRLAGGPEPYG